MNPFDLRGEQFLIFYLVAATSLVALMALARRIFEGGTPEGLRHVDPYETAYLRGGVRETLQVAVFSLLDRGLLESRDGELFAKPEDVDRVRRPLEKEVLRKFTAGSRATGIFFSDRAREACDQLGEDLRRRGLLPTSRQVAARVALGVSTVALLWAIAVIKIQVALTRGHHNIQFLVLLALALPIFVGALLRSRRTALGDRHLENLQSLFAGLRDRAEGIGLGGATNEMTLLLGLFGYSALWGAAHERFLGLFPSALRVSSASGSGGSSCGSSSCGGGGGGGDGGCGGGGCGGCGS